MIEVVKNHSWFKTSLLILALATTATFSEAQESWSDSAPRVMKIARNCPLKVRDKNGEWANFKDSLPAGRSVIGAINPRRPDVVFFQLTRDSRFMFLAARTCFAGEENWNELVEEESGESTKLGETHTYAFGSYGRTTHAAEADGATASASFNEYGIGFGLERLNAEQWYLGGGLAAAYGRAYTELTYNDLVFEDTTPFYTFSGFGSAYYDFKTLPYAMGIEPYLKYTIVKSQSGVDAENGETITAEGGGGLSFGAMLAWRFYAEQFTITPKISFGFSPRENGFQIQLAHIFDPR